MNFKIKFKENKGITLIALAVTIVVLIILAGVSISMLTGENGILNRTNESKEKTKNEQVEELINLSALEALTTGNGKISDIEIKTALNNNVGFGKYTIIGDEITKWKVTVKENKKTYQIDSSGKIAEFGGWIDNGDNTFTNLEGQTLQIGDYINYSCVKGVDISTEIEGKTIYTSKVEANGTENQIFKLADYEDIKWQLIGIDEEGCLKLISSDIITPNGQTYYDLTGQSGYINGAIELDKISSLYGQGKYAKLAKSVDVEDINRITGYVDNSYHKDTNSVDQSGNRVTYTIEVDGKLYYQGTKYPRDNTLSNYLSFTYWTGKEWKGLANREKAILEHNYYEYYSNTLTTYNDGTISINGKTDEASVSAYNLLFANASSKRYWLNSQYIGIYGGFVGWGIRSIYDRKVDGSDLYYSFGGGRTREGCVRPIVYLKPSVKITEGNGSENLPYNLVEY